jgi:hypothetical protein
MTQRPTERSVPLALSRTSRPSAIDFPNCLALRRGRRDTAEAGTQFLRQSPSVDGWALSDVLAREPRTRG